MTALDDFPWVDPHDTGYDVVDFDPEQDMAPEGEEHDCSGDPDGVE